MKDAEKSFSWDDKEWMVSEKADRIAAEAPEANHDETVQNLVEKGFAKDAHEAENFVKTLRETLRTSNGIRTELDGFGETFSRIVSDAETHLADLEKDMEGSFEDRNAVFRQIAEQLAVNFDDVIRSEKQGLYKPNVARRFANMVSRNKAALVAVSVFTAVLRLGGGVAHAAEVHPYAGDHLSDGYVPHDDGADVYYTEHGGPDTEPDHSENHSENGYLMAGRDFEYVSDLIARDAGESDGQEDPDSIHSQIEHIHAAIESGKGDPGHAVYDLKSGEVAGRFDPHRLQEGIRTDGSVRVLVHSFTEIRLSEMNDHTEEQFESAVSVDQVHEAGGSHGHGFEGNVKMSAEGGTPEGATLQAINELSEYMGVHVRNETFSETVEDLLHTAENTMTHTVTAGNHVIDISSIEIDQHMAVDEDGRMTEDENGHPIVIYTATVVGHGV